MKKIYYIVMAGLVLAVLAACAGCTAPAVDAKPAYTPLEMQEALDELTDDLVLLEHSLVADLTNVSASLGAAETDEELQKVLSEYYAAHPCLTAVVYRDNTSGNFISVPVFIDIDLSSYEVGLTGQSFNAAGGMIVRHNVFTRYHGYQNFYIAPVYGPDGTYRGCVVFVVDVYSLLYLHPAIIDKQRSYKDYICFLTYEDRIIYSSIPEATDQLVPAEGFYDGLAYIPAVASGDGACTYTSRGFYLYDSEQQTEKLTCWHTLYSSHGQKYTIYLVERLNLPEMKMKNVYSPQPLQALNDTRGAYMYAMEAGKQKLMERIASGYYETPLSVVDMDGNVLASSSLSKTGLNYLNVRGMYGVSYIESATIAAEQGGGYIYYLTPAEQSVAARAAQYTLGIVMPVGEEYYIFGSTPGSPDAVLLNSYLREDVSVVSHMVLKEVSASGVAAVAAKINDNRGAGADIILPGMTATISDIAILDREGTVYAAVLNPENVNRSATFKTDVYGGSLTRRSGILAETGGGYLTQLYPNATQEGYADLWIAKIEPVDDTYYIYTAAYVTTVEDVLTPCMGRTKPTV